MDVVAHPQGLADTARPVINICTQHEGVESVASNVCLAQAKGSILWSICFFVCVGLTVAAGLSFSSMEDVRKHLAVGPGSYEYCSPSLTRVGCH